MNCLSVWGIMGNKNGFFQTNEEYAEEVKCSELLHYFLYDEVWECVEASSRLLESVLEPQETKLVTYMRL